MSIDLPIAQKHMASINIKILGIQRQNALHPVHDSQMSKERVWEEQDWRFLCCLSSH